MPKHPSTPESPLSFCSGSDLGATPSDLRPCIPSVPWTDSNPFTPSELDGVSMSEIAAAPMHEAVNSDERWEKERIDGRRKSQATHILEMARQQRSLSIQRSVQAMGPALKPHFSAND